MVKVEKRLDFDCTMFDKARQKADGGGRQAKACHLFGGVGRVSSLEYREKHYSIESTIEYSIDRELPIENLGKVLLDC